MFFVLMNNASYVNGGDDGGKLYMQPVFPQFKILSSAQIWAVIG